MIKKILKFFGFNKTKVDYCKVGDNKTRMVFKIPVGELSTKEVEKFMQDMKEKMKRPLIDDAMIVYRESRGTKPIETIIINH